MHIRETIITNLHSESTYAEKLCEYYRSKQTVTNEKMQEYVKIYQTCQVVGGGGDPSPS